MDNSTHSHHSVNSAPCLIELSGNRGRGHFAKVSPRIFQYLNQYKWFLNHDGYAIRNVKTETGRSHISMHREIMGNPRGEEVDHIDGDRLNNTDDNLRIATRSENMRNQHRLKGTKKTSKYRGVYYNKKNKKWETSVTVNGKQIKLGCFESEDFAVRVRDGAALALHGEFASLAAPHLEPITYPLEKRKTTSRFIGVYYHQALGKFVVMVKRKHVGSFYSETEAALARDRYIIENNHTDLKLNILNHTPKQAEATP
jgi:hypothetical protein